MDSSGGGSAMQLIATIGGAPEYCKLACNESVDWISFQDSEYSSGSQYLRMTCVLLACLAAACFVADLLTRTEVPLIICYVIPALDTCSRFKIRI